MTPFQGAGAGQAIEVCFKQQPYVSTHLNDHQDAYILSALLSSTLTTRATISKTLKVYSDVRLPFAAKVFDSSRKSGMHYGFYDAKNPSLDSSEWNLQKLAEDMQKNCDWLTDAQHPKDMMESALRSLEKDVI